MNEAVTVAKEQRKEAESDGALTLSTGVKARLKSVSQSIIQDAIALCKEPMIPMWANPDKDGREEPNPLDPGYLKAMEEYQSKIRAVTFDTFAMFGIELVDGLPDDDKWLREIRVMAKLGHLDLSKFDLEDEIDCEFLYKRYVAMGNADYVIIGAMSGISQEEVRQAADSFPGDEERGEDREGSDPGLDTDGDSV